MSIEALVVSSILFVGQTDYCKFDICNIDPWHKLYLHVKKTVEQNRGRNSSRKCFIGK